MSTSSLDDAGDHELMERMRKGEEAALRVLFDRHAEKLLNYGVKFCGRPSLSEDALQNTFLYLYRKRHEYQPDAPLTALLFKVMRNELLNLLRTKRKEPNPDVNLDAFEPDEPVRTPPENVRKKENQSHIEKAIRQLPEHQREAVLLRVFEKFSYKHIAHVLDVPIGTVKSRLSQGLTRLRDIVRNQYPEELPESLKNDLS